jgi:hypothetical protein
MHDFVNEQNQQKIVKERNRRMSRIAPEKQDHKDSKDKYE